MSSQDEWVRMFDAIDAEGRRYVLAVLRGEYERVRPLPRTRLRLVSGSNVVTGFSKSQIDPLSVSGAS